MNKQAVWAIAKKDIKSIGANIQVWLPMVIVPALIGVVLPGLIIGLLSGIGIGDNSDLTKIVGWLDKLPAGAVKVALDGMTSADQKVAFMVANYLLAPLFLLIPLMTSSVISADSFAGEKERGTLETLLFAPVDLVSLFTGKLLAAFLPTVGLSLATFILCAIAVNAAGWNLFHALFFPTLNWLPLMLVLIPMISLAAILVNVFISARVATFQAAYQMGGVIVLPMIALLFGQATGVIMLGAGVTLAIGLVVAVINFVMLRLLLTRLDRSRLFESQIR